MIYDWASRHEAACRIVRETHPSETPSRISGEVRPWMNRTGTFCKNPRKHGTCARRECGRSIWGSATTGWKNALWRLRHGELDGAEDNAVCVVLLGTNNLAENTDGEILEGIRAVCREITGKLAKAVIILQGFYPRNSAREGTAERIVGINLLLNRLATEEKFHLYGTGTRHG